MGQGTWLVVGWSMLFGSLSTCLSSSRDRVSPQLAVIQGGKDLNTCVGTAQLQASHNSSLSCSTRPHSSEQCCQLIGSGRYNQLACQASNGHSKSRQNHTTATHVTTVMSEHRLLDATGLLVTTHRTRQVCQHSSHGPTVTPQHSDNAGGCCADGTHETALGRMFSLSLPLQKVVRRQLPNSFSTAHATHTASMDYDQ